MTIGKDRKRITSYVPLDLYEIVESVQSKNDYSQSQAIEVILRYFRDNWQGDTLPSLPSESPVTVEQVKLLIDQEINSVINSDTLSKLEKINSVIDSDILSNPDAVIERVLVKQLPDREKLEKAIALVDEQEEISGKIETLARHNKEMEAELREARERIEELEEQYKEEKVGTYPEDSIKLLETEPETSEGEEIPSAIAKLESGTELTGKQLAELMGVDPSYMSKYKSAKLTPPPWFLDNFKAIGKGNKSKWVKK